MFDELCHGFRDRRRVAMKDRADLLATDRGILGYERKRLGGCLAELLRWSARLANDAFRTQHRADFPRGRLTDFELRRDLAVRNVPILVEQFLDRLDALRIYLSHRNQRLKRYRLCWLIVSLSKSKTVSTVRSMSASRSTAF